MSVRTVGQHERVGAIPDDAIDDRGPAAARKQAVGRAMPVEVVEETEAAGGVDDGVVDDERIALVLHGNASLAAIDDQIIENDRSSLVAKHDAVIVAAHD